jgi:hypothetical protein
MVRTTFFGGLPKTLRRTGSKILERPETSRKCLLGGRAAWPVSDARGHARDKDVAALGLPVLLARDGAHGVGGGHRATS